MLQQCIRTKSGDFAYSPLSVTSILALISQAANGRTFEQIRKGLHLSNDKALIADQFLDFYELFDKVVGNSSLSIVNQIYMPRGYQLNRDFEEVAAKKFKSGVRSLNFASAEKSAQIINKFVEEKTKKKIKDLIKADALNEDTRVILVNAIYFKDNWKYQFDMGITYTGDFYISENEKNTVDYMTNKNYYSYAILEDLDATAVELEYANSNISFVIMLPNNRTGLSALETKLKDYDFATIIERMNAEEVQITIPKFKVEFEIHLNEILKNVCMHASNFVDMFDFPHFNSVVSF